MSIFSDSSEHLTFSGSYAAAFAVSIAVISEGYGISLSPASLSLRSEIISSANVSSSGISGIDSSA